VDSGGEDGTGRWGIVNIYVRTRRTGRPVAWRTNLLLLKIVENKCREMGKLPTRPAS